MNGSPQGEAIIECHLDWCAEDGLQRYAVGPTGGCGPDFVAGPVLVQMPAGDCRAMGGTAGLIGELPADTWAPCALDLCFSSAPTTFFPTRTGARPRAGYGIIHMTAADCRNAGGAMNGTPGDSDWTDCHFDWSRR